MKAAPDTLPLVRKLGYGLGDFGLVLTWQMVGLFLLYFMTDIAGISPVLAGAIIFGGLLWDGLIDIAVGSAADRTRTRFGRYRPWLLVGGPLLGLSFSLVFIVPPFEGVWVLVAMITAQLIFRLFYAVVGIPYGALSSAMTISSQSRGTLAGFRMTGSTLGSLAVAIAVPPMVAAFGAGDERLGYSATAAVVGFASAILILICFTSSREIVHVDQPAAYRLSALPRLIWHNPPFLMVAGCLVCQATAMHMLLAGAPYFYGHVRGSPDSLGPTMGLLIGGVVVSVPFWTLVMQRIGKRMTWLIGAAWSSLGLVGAALLSQAEQSYFLTAMGLTSIGFGSVVLTAFAMLPDTVEYGEWRSGIRVEAGLFSALVLAQKTATGLATWLIGLMVAWSGHSQISPMSGDAARYFGLGVFLVPAVFLSLSILIVWRYPISASYHRQLVERLARRKNELSYGEVRALLRNEAGGVV